MPRKYKEHVGGLPYRRWRLRVILADDQTILRHGLRAILDAEPDLEVIGEASNMQDAVALSRRLLPDVVITDVAFIEWHRNSGHKSAAARVCRCARAAAYWP